MGSVCGIQTMDASALERALIIYARAFPGEVLIVGIREHLEHHVEDAAPIVGVADIHAGALPDGFQLRQRFHNGESIIAEMNSGPVDFHPPGLPTTSRRSRIWPVRA